MTHPVDYSGRVAVAILNYNGRELLERYLPSALEFADGAVVYVIDNGSTDDSLAYLQSLFETLPPSGLRVLPLDRNYGFCGGYNRGIAQIEEPLVVLLNSDVRVTDGWLAPLMDAFDDTSVVACQPKILSDRDPTSFEYAGGAGGFLDGYGYPYCRGRVFDVVEEDKRQYDQPMDIDWATGACMMVRKQAFLEAGGLYEPLFAHMEEIDLCWRFRAMGLRVRVAPASVVYHLGGATLSIGHPRKTYLNFRNNLTVITRNMPKGRLLWLIPVRLTLDGIAGIQFLAKGKPRHTWAIVMAHYGYYAWLLWPSVGKPFVKWPGRRITTQGIQGPLPWYVMILKRQTWYSLHRSA